MKKIYKLCQAMIVIAALFAMMGFASCEGPMGPVGPQGDPAPAPQQPVKVVNIDTTPEVDLFLGQSVMLTASAKPTDATVKTLLWELYSADDGLIIDMGGLSIVTGDSVTVKSLNAGIAKILVTALGSGEVVKTQIVTITVQGLLTRINEIPSLLDKLGAGDDKAEFVFDLYGSEVVPPTVLDFSEDYPGIDVEITLKRGVEAAAGSMFTLQLASQGSIFTIGEGVTLNLEDGITLKGIDNNNVALVLVKADGKLTMDTGTKITGNTNTFAHTYTSQTSLPPTTANNGAGVFVEANGEFIMKGGEISNNNQRHGTTVGLVSFVGGGGVLCAGTFTMENGKISDNFANVGAGVLVYPNGTFTMEDGEIVDNYSLGEGSGVYVASIWDQPSTASSFTMRSGLISRNRGMAGAGVYLFESCTFEMFDGEISYNDATAKTMSSSGGGVAFQYDCKVTMHNGKIINNIAGSGGGVNNNSGAPGFFIMLDGEISGNKAVSSTAAGDSSDGTGGGILNTGHFTMHNGKISDNESTGQGGGVHTTGNNRSFTMNGGEISGNSAVILGGGVNMLGSSTFNMNAGKIYNNTAENGGGVCIGGSVTFNMKGGEIYGNEAESGAGVLINSSQWYSPRLFMTLGEDGVAFGKIYGNTAQLAGGGVAIAHENGTLGIMYGLIRGNDGEDDGTRNIAAIDAALYGVARYGTNLLAPAGTIPSTSSTIKVVNGVLEGAIIVDESTGLSITGISNTYEGKTGVIQAIVNDMWTSVGFASVTSGVLTVMWDEILVKPYITLGPQDARVVFMDGATEMATFEGEIILVDGLTTVVFGDVFTFVAPESTGLKITNITGFNGNTGVVSAKYMGDWVEAARGTVAAGELNVEWHASVKPAISLGVWETKVEFLSGTTILGHYEGDVTLVAGITTVSLNTFTNMGLSTGAKVTGLGIGYSGKTGVVSVYMGTSWEPVASATVASNALTIDWPLAMGDVGQGQYNVRLTFMDGSTVLGVYEGIVTLGAGVTTFSLTDFNKTVTSTGLIIEDIDISHEGYAGFIYVNYYGVEELIAGAEISDGVLSVSWQEEVKGILFIEPTLWNVILKITDGNMLNPYIFATYQGQVDLVNGDTTMNFVTDFTPVP